MLHLILGPMFSGKSTRLIYHIRQFKTLDYPLCIVKPDIDKRYSSNEICTHNLDNLSFKEIFRVEQFTQNLYR